MTIPKTAVKMPENSLSGHFDEWPALDFEKIAKLKKSIKVENGK